MSVSVNGKRSEILSTLADFLSVDTRPIVEEPVPEFGYVETADGQRKPKVILLRAMSSQQKDDWELRWIGDDEWESDPDKAKALDRKMTYRERLGGQEPGLLSRCIVNEAGEPIFSEKDVSALAQINGGVIRRLYLKARVLCGFDTPTPAAQVGNSVARPADERPSA